MAVYDFAAASVRAPSLPRPEAATGASLSPPGLARPGVRELPAAVADSRPITSIAAYRASCRLAEAGFWFWRVRTYATPRGPVWHASAVADDGRRVRARSRRGGEQAIAALADRADTSDEQNNDDHGSTS